MLAKPAKDKFEISLPYMHNNDISEFFSWCTENDIDAKIIHKKGVIVFKTDTAKYTTFFSVEDMQKDGWDENLSERTKNFIKRLTPKKLEGQGKYAIVENEMDLMAVKLRWT